MKRNALKVFKALCGVVVVLALSMAGITAMSAYAADNGIYIATATPHYRNPQTGVIEDSGGDGSAVLGQSMTESATYRQALVEVDSSGNTFVTIRLQLMDNIRNPQFQVDGTPVSATLMQEDYTNNTADYRMKVDSENSVIRCNMNVIAMGRDVIFYITVSNLQEGSGDFITSIMVEKKTAAPENNSSSGYSDSSSSLGNTQNNNAADSNAVSGIAAEPEAKEQVHEATIQENIAKENVVQESTDGEQVQENTIQESTAQESTASNNTEASSQIRSSEVSTKSSGASGLAEYDASGNKVTAASEDNVKGSKTSKAPVIIAVVVIVLAAGCGAGYFVYKKRK